MNGEPRGRGIGALGSSAYLELVVVRDQRFTCRMSDIVAVKLPRVRSVLRIAWFAMVLIVGTILILPLVFGLWQYYAWFLSFVQGKE